MTNIVIADSKGWFFSRFREESDKYLAVTKISEKESLTLDYLNTIKPKYIFFAHWSWVVAPEIHEKYECIVFHTSPLPFGRGGSPIQNLIRRGYKSGPVCAIRMTSKLDAGPIYLKEEVSLDGRLDSIFERIFVATLKMIKEISLSTNLDPVEQEGDAVVFKRLTREDNCIDFSRDIEYIYDQIRMVDGLDYPKAYLEKERFTIEFQDARVEGESVLANAKIFKKSKKSIKQISPEKESLSFIEVDPCNTSHVIKLYDLLTQRKHSISNKGTTSFADHQMFVERNPYLFWYLIECRSETVGSLYILDDNCVGINIHGNYQHLLPVAISFVKENHSPRPGIRSKRSEQFFINIASSDAERMRIMHDLGATPIQSTFLI